MFDDGDENTLRRSKLCLKGSRHFMKSEVMALFLCLLFIFHFADDAHRLCTQDVHYLLLSREEDTISGLYWGFTSQTIDRCRQPYCLLRIVFKLVTYCSLFCDSISSSYYCNVSG